jgi:hypothetical protein
MKKAIIKQHHGSFVHIVKTVKHKPVAGNQQPVAGSQQPVAGSQQPVASSQQPATIFYLLIFTLLFSGCEKVIDVDLNEADPHIVIEGNLSYNPDSAIVKISMTSGYFDTLPSEKVSRALVTVSNGFGEKFRFKETAEGIYQSKQIRLRPGDTYRLEVEANGEKYESSSLLNSSVPIDSVKFYYEEGFSFFESGYYVNFYIFDPPGIKNYYRVKHWKNGVYQNSIDDFYILDDRYVDGNNIEINLFRSPFEYNDTITLQLISLDEGAYEYFKTFEELVNNNPGSAAPANPNSNISNGALGYFSAWSSHKRTFIIKTE